MGKCLIFPCEPYYDQICYYMSKIEPEDRVLKEVRECIMLGMLETVHTVLAECGVPWPKRAPEFFCGLERKGVIELKKQ